jgi:hypothetical protein
MIVAALVETNNMYRYSKFADKLFNLWRVHPEDPINFGSTFLDTFQIWLRTNYSSNEGNRLGNNEKEGAIRYLCSRNLPTLVLTSHNNVRGFHETMNSFSWQTVTDIVYRNTLRTLDKLMEGASDECCSKWFFISNSVSITIGASLCGAEHAETVWCNVDNRIATFKRTKTSAWTRRRLMYLLGDF